MPFPESPTEKVCRPCAEARGATFRDGVPFEYELGGCKFCGSPHHVVYPTKCWSWPLPQIFDSRKEMVENLARRILGDA
jgi:hypothetical protein